MEVALGEVLEGIVWTGGGRIESCNAAFEGLLGRSRLDPWRRLPELLPLGGGPSIRLIRLRA
jgi:PAS domain-containing protein